MALEQLVQDYDMLGEAGKTSKAYKSVYDKLAAQEELRKIIKNYSGEDYNVEELSEIEQAQKLAQIQKEYSDRAVKYIKSNTDSVLDKLGNQEIISAALMYPISEKPKNLSQLLNDYKDLASLGSEDEKARVKAFQNFYKKLPSILERKLLERGKSKEDAKFWASLLAVGAPQSYVLKNAQEEIKRIEKALEKANLKNYIIDILSAGKDGDYLKLGSIAYGTIKSKKENGKPEAPLYGRETATEEFEYAEAA